jgi:hypothetical protein
MHDGSPFERGAPSSCVCTAAALKLIMRHALSTPPYAGFQVVDVSVQDLPDPMGRLRAIPLFAEQKDLDLRPHPPHGVAMHHAAQRIKSWPDIAIWPARRKPDRTGQVGINLDQLWLEFLGPWSTRASGLQLALDDERRHCLGCFAKLPPPRVHKSMMSSHGPLTT